MSGLGWRKYVCPSCRTRVSVELTDANVSRVWCQGCEEDMIQPSKVRRERGETSLRLYGVEP